MPPQPPSLGSDEQEKPEDSESVVKADGKYAADVPADFQGNHFSGWGWQLGQAKGMIRDVVNAYRPDVVLTLLGFNDIGWGFYGCPAGYDGLHPNVLGEFEIARAFSLALHERFDIGDTALEVPSPRDMPQRPRPVPMNVVATGAPMGVTVTWDPVFGARGYDVRNRMQGKDKWEVAQAQSNRFDTTFTVAGIAWEYQVRTNNGDGDKDKSEWSPVSTAVARRDTAPPPQNIQTFSKDHGIRVTWSPVEGDWEVDRYAVTVLDQDTPGAIIICYGFRGSEATLQGLRNGNCYSVFVGTWAFVDGVSVGGLPAKAASVTPGDFLGRE
ncbi:hypothetical protein D0862_11594 [Hortaea werneckii]|uniref:Fibronectin type-III domain-containing protein n=1 Tax=Hortaea werneckii TaxID=91943 RepID=A0A3M7F4L9_HORWE|nr:hypothetical protein D0862_11594 [Hortaea werneckii]